MFERKGMLPLRCHSTIILLHDCYAMWYTLHNTCIAQKRFYWAHNVSINLTWMVVLRLCLIPLFWFPCHIVGTDLGLQFSYRLTRCGVLSLGLFTTALPSSKMPAETLSTGQPTETGRENGAVSVLMAHIVCTQTNDPVVTDEAMDMPRDWISNNPPVSKSGHQESGSTICLHSLITW